MNNMMLSFRIKGDVISDYFLMLWFQKDSLDTVGFRTFRTFYHFFDAFPKQKMKEEEEKSSPMRMSMSKGKKEPRKEENDKA